MKVSIPSSPRSFIHYDLNRIDYSVTDAELRQLELGFGSVWKDWFLVSISTFLPTALNAVGEYTLQPTFDLTPSLFLNSLIAMVSFFSSAAFATAWKKSARHRDDFFKRIREKPRVVLNISDVACNATDERDHTN